MPIRQQARTQRSRRLRTRGGLPRYDPAIAPAIGAMCFLTGILLGLILIVMGLRALKHEKELIGFAAWVRTYRRVALGELANKLGKTVYETEKVLVEVVDKNLVPGFIDRSTNEFVLQEAVGQEQLVRNCPNCGATLQRRYFIGESVVCPYCNSTIFGQPPERQPWACVPGAGTVAGEDHGQSPVEVSAFPTPTVLSTIRRPTWDGNSHCS